MWKFANPIKHPIPETRWPTRKEATRSLLFQPIQIGPVTLESRTWVPAMVPWRATEDGFVTQENLDWYRRFAEGQPAALVVEATGIRDIPSGPLLRIGHARFIPGLKRLVDTVREASKGHTKLFIQIIDFLAVKRRPEEAKYFNRFLKITWRHRQTIAEVTTDSNWLGAEETKVRTFLNNASDEVIERVLNNRELESLRFGYRDGGADAVCLVLLALRVCHVRLDVDASLRLTAAGDEPEAREQRQDQRASLHGSVLHEPRFQRLELPRVTGVFREP